MTTAAFDTHADSYDAIAKSALGRELRTRVHAALDSVTAPGDAVIDLGCGTGIDAAWLAPQVASVEACDASAEMVALTQQRCASLPNVTVIQADAASMPFSDPVDLVLANFGVINCVGDIGAFGDRLAAMLKPGGLAVLVTMGHWCPIELGVALISGNRALLTRRGRAHPGADYPGLTLQYFSAGHLARKLGDRFALVGAESLGLVLPPLEQRSWVERRDGLRNRLATLDRRLGPIGARVGLGDHHIAVLKRTP